MSSLTMARRRRKRPELNLVPLIDVLVMLVFFSFVTMQFRSSATLNITLPKVETAGKNEYKGPVTLGIDKDGEISFAVGNGVETIVKPGELEALLQRIKEIDRDTPVLIKADETTPLKTLTYVMDSCRKSGLNRFSLQSR